MKHLNICWTGRVSYKCEERSLLCLLPFCQWSILIYGGTLHCLWKSEPEWCLMSHLTMCSHQLETYYREGKPRDRDKPSHTPHSSQPKHAHSTHTQLSSHYYLLPKIQSPSNLTSPSPSVTASTWSTSYSYLPSLSLFLNSIHPIALFPSPHQHHLPWLWLRI